MEDALYSGRRFRTLNVLDEANREALAIEIGTSIAARVVRVLEQLIAIYGRPRALRLDNGPELTAQLFTEPFHVHGANGSSVAAASAFSAGCGVNPILAVMAIANMGAHT